MSNNNLTPWEMSIMFAPNERKAVLGTMKTSSHRTKPERGNRPYGGTAMSKARLYATGPTRNYVAQRTSDITG